MTDSKKISRRDWFRLRLPTSNDPPKDDRQRSMGQSTGGLKPIAEPINHDGMDLSQLPPMHEALLSTDEVSQLFVDIEALATDVLLLQRASRQAHSAVSGADTKKQLVAAKDALLSSSISRLQIRYRWQDKAWIDTLESRPDGYRLIRISHE